MMVNRFTCAQCSAGIWLVFLLMQVACVRSPYPFELPGPYDLMTFAGENAIHIRHKDETKAKQFVPPQIVEMAFDKSVIIAKQLKQPYQKGYWCESPGAFAHWVVDVNDEAIFGPFSEPELLSELAKLGLPNLDLKDIHDYF